MSTHSSGEADCPPLAAPDVEAPVSIKTQHPTYLELLCHLAGVSMEALAEADASVRGLPEPFDGLRVTLNMALFMRGHSQPVYPDPVSRATHKPMRDMIEVVIRATGPKLKRGTDRDLVVIKRGATSTDIPPGCTNPFPAAFRAHADRMERDLRWYLECNGGKVEPGLEDAVRVTVGRLRALASQVDTVKEPT